MKLNDLITTCSYLDTPRADVDYLILGVALAAIFVIGLLQHGRRELLKLEVSPRKAQLIAPDMSQKSSRKRTMKG